MPSRRRPAPNPAAVLRRSILAALATLPLDEDELAEVVAAVDVVTFRATLDELMAGRYVVRDERDAALFRLPPLG